MAVELNGDVYEEIFKHLDCESLKKCALVCKQWNDIISSSEVTMKKFEYTMDKNSICDDTKLSTTRKHRNLRVEDRSLPRTECKEMIGLSLIKNLTFSIANVLWLDLCQLTTLVVQMPALEELDFFLHHRPILERSSVFPILPNLRKLHIFSTSSTVLKYFGNIIAPNLRDLTYEGYHDKNVPEDFHKLIMNASHLSNLSLSASLMKSLLEQGHVGNTTLQKLCVYGKESSLTDMASGHLIELLSRSASTIKHLTLPSSFITKRVNYVIDKLVDRLATFFISNLTRNNPLVQIIPGNVKLRSLIIDHDIQECIPHVLRSVPNIAVLSIYVLDDHILRAINKFNKNLKTLQVRSIVGLAGTDVTLDNLRIFCVSSASLDNLLFFIKRCPILHEVILPKWNNDPALICSLVTKTHINYFVTSRDNVIRNESSMVRPSFVKVNLKRLRLDVNGDEELIIKKMKCQ